MNHSMSLFFGGSFCQQRPRYQNVIIKKYSESENRSKNQKQIFTHEKSQKVVQKNNYCTVTCVRIKNSIFTLSLKQLTHRKSLIFSLFQSFYSKFIYLFFQHFKVKVNFANFFTKKKYAACASNILRQSLLYSFIGPLWRFLIQTHELANLELSAGLSPPPANLFHEKINK